MSIGDFDFSWNGNYWEPHPAPTPAPVITSVKPNTIPAQSGPQTITITGTGLCGLSVIEMFNDAYQSGWLPYTGNDTQITFQLPDPLATQVGGATANVGAGSTGGSFPPIGEIWVGQPAQPTVQPTRAVLFQDPVLPVTEGAWARTGAGTGLLAIPANVAAANTASIPGETVGVVDPDQAWPSGTFITFGDASEGYWNGTAWVAGRSP